MATLKEQREAALKAARDIADAATKDARDLTDEERATVTSKLAEVDELDVKIKRAAEDAELIAKIAAVPSDDEDDTPVGGAQTKARVGGMGDVFVQSGTYKAWAAAHPSGVGQGTPINIGSAKVGTLADIRTKADPGPLALSDAHVPNLRFPTVDLTYPAPLALLDLITRGQAAGAFEYLQITSVTNNADVVGEATTATGSSAASGLKPLSDLSTDLADAKVFTYADGFTVTNQMLADAPALATFLNARLSYNLNDVIEDYLLNGTGNTGVPKGILHTTGVQSQPFDTDMVTTVRRAITKVTKKGGRVTAVVMSPEDDEAWDLLKDNTGRYYGQGPFGSGPGTAWGRPRVVSQRISQGTFILGDWSTVTLLDREGLSVTAFNQHADYARRNLTYVRAELRAVQAIFEPAKLVVGSLVSSGSSSS